MALPGCLAELLANLLADFVADVPKFLSPSNIIRAQFRVHCRPQNPLSARQNKQTIRASLAQTQSTKKQG